MKKLSEEDINELYTYCALNENGKILLLKLVKLWVGRKLM